MVPLANGGDASGVRLASREQLVYHVYKELRQSSALCVLVRLCD